jgi:glycosyltransferase involved in cell wall biosynthesis
MSANVPGRVSAIIPARNEEANIERAVRTLASQQGVREILVIDDQSEDRTGEILEGLKSEVAGLRVIRVDSLPEGWTGKAHAAATGAREASGAWLLFTDADTEHLSGSLTALLERAEQEGADLLSVSPGQRTETWWEKAVIPLVYVKLARLYRFEEVSDPHSPAAAANGQYILVRREIYERVGGHAAVRAEILEDVELARRIKSLGGRLVFLPGSSWVRTRMYRTFSQMWRGWTKNLYLLYGHKLVPMLAALAESLLLDVFPTLAFIALALWVGVGHRGTAPVVGAAGLCLFVLWRHWRYGQALSRLGFGLRLASYQVPGAMLFGLLLMNSLAAYRLIGRVAWKGRAYATKGKG